MTKHGFGKQISLNGSFQEGTWDNDKLTGPSCRIYDSENGSIFHGSVDDGKRSGYGKSYDAEKDEVYEGLFESDKRSGDGTLFMRNGQVYKGTFRNNNMEGE